MKIMRLKKELETRSLGCINMSTKILGRSSKLCHDQKSRHESRQSRKHYRLIDKRIIKESAQSFRKCGNLSQRGWRGHRIPT